MFTNARMLIKTSLIFFIVGMLAGLPLLGQRFFGWAVPYGVQAAHVHLLLIGGMVMMILGVAIWFFPRPPAGDKKYNPTIILILYYALTLATILRFPLEAHSILPWILFTASLVQILSIIGIVYSIWGRIRAVGSQIREKKGERF
ncbi:MAG: hypothetical protein H8E64_07265 [Candidatus Marinimicrobia bacterium]|nr:hypothetical protein [Candidatus Neomarinimicrobiota bacterium]